MLLADVQQGPGLFSAVRVLHTIASSSLMPVSLSGWYGHCRFDADYTLRPQGLSGI